MSVWYFAYGSNMQTATFRGRRGIEFARALPARVTGWRLVLDKPGMIPVGHSFANIVRDTSSEVLGVLYEISEEALGVVDLTEGVLIGNYERVTVQACPLVGSPADAFDVQTLTSPQRDAALLPSTRYMDLLIEGALEHGLPETYVERLRGLPAVQESAIATEFRPLMDTFFATIAKR